MARQIITEIVADPKKFKQGMAEAQGHAQKFGSVLQGIGQGIGQGIYGGVMRATDAVGSFMTGSLTAASDLNETMSKVNVVFGKNSEQMKVWASTSATALGMSKNTALSAAGTFGNLFVSMGMATDKSADMSRNLVGLASDLA